MSRFTTIMLSTYAALFLTGFAWISYQSAPGIIPGFGLSQPACEALVSAIGMLAFGTACLLFANAIILGTIAVIRHGFNIRR